jgi:hypothetical protein
VAVTSALLLAVAVASGVLVAVGTGLVYMPAGLIVAGLELLAAAWCAAYALNRSSEGRGPR